MHYREPFFQRACGEALAELPSQTLRFFAARRMRDKISDDTLAWYRRMYSDANGGWAHTRTLLLDAAAFCRDRDIVFTVAIFPPFYRLDGYPVEDVHRRLGEFAAGEGIDWIDLLPSQGRAGYWVHPRPPKYPPAHREAAEFLYSAVDW